MIAHLRPDKQQRSHRSYQLRAKGFTWEQIADVWEVDYPAINPRVAFRWAHNLTFQGVTDRWNDLDPGEPTMHKKRIFDFEYWPDPRGRRPSVAALRMLARIYETTGPRLLSDDEYGRYDAVMHSEIERIDFRHLDERYLARVGPDSELSTEHIGKRIAQLRKQRRLTQNGLAQRANFSVSLVEKVESGHKIATQDFVDAVAAALKVDPSEIRVCDGGNEAEAYAVQRR